MSPTPPLGNTSIPLVLSDLPDNPVPVPSSLYILSPRMLSFLSYLLHEQNLTFVNVRQGLKPYDKLNLRCWCDSHKGTHSFPKFLSFPPAPATPEEKETEKFGLAYLCEYDAGRR